jgi:hypothetical protein
MMTYLSIEPKEMGSKWEGSGKEVAGTRTLLHRISWFEAEFQSGAICHTLDNRILVPLLASRHRGGREAAPCDIVRLLHRRAAGYKLIRQADPQRI